MIFDFFYSLTSNTFDLNVDPSTVLNFDTVAFELFVKVESVQNFKATNVVGDIVWAFPSLCLISNDDLADWKYCRGVIQYIDTTRKNIKVAFFVGPVPIKKEVVGNLLQRRYTGEDNTSSDGSSDKKKFPSVLRSLWFFRQLFVMLRLPKNASSPDLDLWLKSNKQKKHEAHGALSLNVERDMTDFYIWIFESEGDGKCKWSFLLKVRTWAMSLYC